MVVHSDPRTKGRADIRAFHRRVGRTADNQTQRTPPGRFNRREGKTDSGPEVPDCCLSRLRGMPVAVDLFRRAFVTSRLNGVYRPFPPRTESSGQREQASVSRTTRTRPTLSPGNCAMQRTTPWLTAILRGPSGMNTGSDYYFDGTGFQRK